MSNEALGYRACERNPPPMPLFPIRRPFPCNSGSGSPFIFVRLLLDSSP